MFFFKGMNEIEREAFIKRSCDIHPLGRLGTIEEVI